MEAAIVPPLLRFVLDRLEDAVFLVDDKQNIVFCNAAAERLTGKDRAGVLGRHCSHVFGGASDEAYCVFQELRESGDERTGRRTLVRHPDGRTVPVEMQIAGVPAEVAGQPLMMGTIRDLSVLERLEAEATERYRFANMISRAPSMKRVFELVRSIADTDVGVLVTGESGTGKELVARAVHDLSPRRASPFHAVNCGALSPELLDSEIFGHEKGAFTGAVRAKPGRLELAEGGTLFLDEIGDMPAPLQVKFLRVLQERVFERVGGTRALNLDARVIAATHADLSAAVAEGRFRQDLFFRVNVVPIHLPPLRERREDIDLLVEHFRRLFLSRSGRPDKRFSEDAMKVLIRYDWPGNIRELINVVEYALAVTAGPVIDPGDLPSSVLNSEMAAMQTLRALAEMAGRPGRAPSHAPVAGAEPADVADPERERLRAALVRHGFRREAAARELGVSRTTLWRLMKVHGLS